MGTHPIFESDFDCLTECVIIQPSASTLPPSLTTCQLMLVTSTPSVTVNAGTTTLTFSAALPYVRRRVRTLSHASTSAAVAQACPQKWTAEWDEQRAQGCFPANKYALEPANIFPE